MNGGLDLAVEHVFGARTIWHAEIEAAPAKVLAAHWPDVPNLGDITTIDWATVERPDILCGGFPCQDISSAGRQAGMGEGTRSGLWSHMAAAIDALRPRYVVIENVRALLSTEANRNTHEGTSTLESTTDAVGDGTDGPVLRALGAVLGDLTDIGYDARWTTLRASAIGAPHHRERVFILAEPADAECVGRTRQGAGPGETSIEGTAGVYSGRGMPPADTDRDRRRQGPRQPGPGEPQEPTTAGGVPALFPTPAAGNFNDGESVDGWLERRERVKETANNGNGMGMPLTIAVQMLPTPGANLGEHRRDNGQNPDKRRAAGRQVSLADVTCHLLTPRTTDANGAGHHGDGGPDLRTVAVATGDLWGKYGPAIRRWEALTRPAPAPTEPNSNGKPRLSARFVEWMMGLPSGWVTGHGLTRGAELKILGNGVVPQQAAAALHMLIDTRAVAS